MVEFPTSPISPSEFMEDFLPRAFAQSVGLPRPRPEHVESRMRWKSHVRFGGRAGETHRSKDDRALRSDPTRPR